MQWRDAGVRGPAHWLAAAAAVLLAGCSAASHSPSNPSVRPVSVTASRTSASPTARATAPESGERTAPSATSPTVPAVPPSPPSLPPSPPPSPSALPVAPGAGRLKQTRTFPSTKSAAFGNAMHDLWLAVTKDTARFALPAFFPEAAYEQVKAIANPRSDWQTRLWYDFTLDVTAAHHLVGGGAALVKVIVPAQYAAWVYPGACYNSIGYWHVPGARVVYRQGGQLRSFGIASLISWRGDWYVIHFGAVTRGGGYGEVDAPAMGTGYPGPPGGC